MKNRFLLVTLIIIIFLYENTSPYWINNIGTSAWIVSLAYFVIFIFAIGYLIYSIVRSVQAKFKDKKHNALTLLLIIVMAIPLIFSGGIFSKKHFYKGELLVAYLDGVAGNNGWLTLYGNNTYEYDYSFSTHLKGKYKVVNDTIYFDSPRGESTYNFDYATLWKDKSNLTFGKDSVGFSYMSVIKNKLLIK